MDAGSFCADRNFNDILGKTLLEQPNIYGSVDTAHEPSKQVKNKKPFLRKGEGVQRRVFASKYKDEAKKKRVENSRTSERRAKRAPTVNAAENNRRQSDANGHDTSNGRQRLGVLGESPVANQYDDTPTEFGFFGGPAERGCPELASESVLLSVDSIKGGSSAPYDLFSGANQPPARQSTESRHAFDAFDENGTLDGTCMTTFDGMVQEGDTRNSGFFGETESKGNDGDDGLNFGLKPPPEMGCDNNNANKDWLHGQDDEALELEEFQVLERQIRRELGESISSAGGLHEAAKFQKAMSIARMNAALPISSSPLPPASNRAEGLMLGQNESHAPPIMTFDDENKWHGASHSTSSSHMRTEVVSNPHHLDCGYFSGHANEVSQRKEPHRRQAIVQTLFKSPESEDTCLRPSKEDTSKEDERLEALEDEIKKFQDERSHLAKLRKQLEMDRQKLEQEKIAWEKTKISDEATFVAMKDEEMKKLKRERRVLEQQSRALLKLPTRKERSEIESLEAILKQERKDAKAKEARHKLTVERLRQQILELQGKNTEIREEVRWHEAQQLEMWEALEKAKEAKVKNPQDKSAQTSPLPEDRVCGRSKQLGAREEAHTDVPDDMIEKEQTLYPSHVSGDMTAFGGQANLVQGSHHDFTCEQAGQDREQHSPQASFLGPSSNQFAPTACAQPPSSHYADTGAHFRHAEPLYYSQAHSLGSGVPNTARISQNALHPSHTVSPFNTASESHYSAYPPDQQYLRPPSHHYPHTAAFAPPAIYDTHNAGFGISASTGRIRPNQGMGDQRLGSAGFMDQVGASQSSCGIRPGAPGEQGVGENCLNIYGKSPPPQHFVNAGGGGPVYGMHWGDGMGNMTQNRMAAASHNGLENRASTHGMCRGGSPSPLTTGIQKMAATTRDMHIQYSQGGSDSRNCGYLHNPPKLPDGQFYAEAMDNRCHNIEPPQASKPHYGESMFSSRCIPSSDLGGGHPQQDVDRVSRSIPNALDATEVHKNRQTTHPTAPVVLQEIQRSDGKIEQHMSDGRRVVKFGNGTVKEVSPDGNVSIHFKNGDVKKTLVGGATEYFYSEVDTWQTSHPNGVEVFYFPSGQKEAHHGGGVKEIVFPDGLVRRVTEDGREVEVAYSDLSPEILAPKPSKAAK